MEQAYKGNFYLLALIDGKERKFVLGKNKKAIPMFINIPHHDIRVVPSAEERMVRGKANHSNTSSMIG